MAFVPQVHAQVLKKLGKKTKKAAERGVERTVERRAEKEASEKTDDRITTYTSELHPRFYWGPLEKIGIEQEHEYVFSNLKKDLKHKYGG